jgi:hypothetical protein
MNLSDPRRPGSKSVMTYLNTMQRLMQINIREFWLGTIVIK